MKQTSAHTPHQCKLHPCIGERCITRYTGSQHHTCQTHHRCQCLHPNREDLCLLQHEDAIHSVAQQEHMLEAAVQAAREAELRRLEQADAGIGDCCPCCLSCHMKEHCGTYSQNHEAADAPAAVFCHSSGLNTQQQNLYLPCRVYARVAKEWAASKTVSAAAGPRHAVHARWASAHMAPLLHTVVDINPAVMLSSLPWTGAMLNRTQLGHLIL